MKSRGDRGWIIWDVVVSVRLLGVALVMVIIVSFLRLVVLCFEYASL